MTLFSCRDATQLMSLAIDRDVPFVGRLTTRVHVAFCPRCSRFRRHLLFLHHAARMPGVDVGGPGVRLSPEARARILGALLREEHRE